MKLGTVSLLRCAVLLSLAITAPSHADWATPSMSYVVRPLPANSQVQPQNPPSFTWPMHVSKPPSYIVEVTPVGGAPTTYTTDRNWFLPSSTLPAGTYSWRVRPSTVVDWSTPRSFIIDATSKPFVVPDNATLKAKILARARPRSLAAGVAPKSAWSAAMATARGPALAALTDKVRRRKTSVPVYTDADWPLLVSGGALTAATATQGAQLRWAMLDLTNQMEGAALLYRITGAPEFLTEAQVRGDQLAALSPYGPTSYKNADLETRRIAMALLKGVDFLGADINVERNADGTVKRTFDHKTVWLKAVEQRTTDIYNAFHTSDGGYDQFPFDSHGAEAQGYLALLATLSLGEIPAAETWFDFTFRAYAQAIYPWSDGGGGFANGTSYGQHTALQSLGQWPAIQAATGVNLFDKPWSVGFLKSYMYFQPPGSMTHTFGDEHEAAPVATELKGFASRFATPEAAWYVKNLVGDEDPLSLLESPWPLPVETVTNPTPPTTNSVLFQSIGWTAMHSNLSDRGRTSVYFKSSPYGSYNHSHGDQNSLLLSSGGRPLLIETGYMDWYGSPLWNDWYRQTKAHNAITIDNGIGQTSSTDGYNAQLNRNGKITSFAATAGLDYVEGDATAAYNGALTSARRQIWYLRTQDAVVVRDKLTSATPHVFEWNFHSAVPMVVGAGNVVTITNVDRSVCVRPVSTDLAFAKRVGAPPKVGTFEDHAVYTRTAATSGEFIIVLDVGCKNPTISMTTTSTGRKLMVGGIGVTLPSP
ncbi:heparinase II/III family protein [Rugamonas sp. A1-17]|nr:heparinase II/III family protein [Rugamonas sp. A1-17]